MAKEVKFKNKIVLGLVEDITLEGEKGNKKLRARIDTGAQNSSIDQTLAAELKLGPIIKNKAIRQSHGRSIRPVVNVNCLLCRKKLRGEFTIADRSEMKYRVLVGQNLLKKGFIIDPLKPSVKKKSKK